LDHKICDHTSLIPHIFELRLMSPAYRYYWYRYSWTG
jgi:hypothetical protein